jgi:hypothetical protein
MGYMQGSIDGRSDRKQTVDGKLEGRVADMITTSRAEMCNILHVYM